jgi:hypothetical protein
MRSVFTVKIPPISADKYPSDDEFLSRGRALGWENIKAKEKADDERKAWYVQKASEIWDQMPEIAAAEKDYVIFYGELQDNQTKFIITRVVEGQATFRLLHPNLDRLQASTAYMVGTLLAPVGNLPALEISNNRISIYERGYDDIIIQGRVIKSAMEETWRVDKKNILLAVGAFLLAVPTFITLIWVNSKTNQILGGTLERASTTFLTTIVVSLIGFIQTYLEIRKHKIIDWAVAASDFARNVK